MKECTVFYDQIIVEDRTGKLVSSPTSSHEHGPQTKMFTNKIEFSNIIIFQLNIHGI